MTWLRVIVSFGSWVGGVQIRPVPERFEAHAPESITALNKQLAATSVSALMAKFDPDVLNAQKIYSSPWDTSDADYIKEHLTRFFSVVRQAAGQRKGIAVFLG